MKKYSLLLLFCSFIIVKSQQIIELPDQGWRLWCDRTATWENDSLFLPGTFNISALPVNAPTVGWQALNPSTGIEVTLPSTVEEHFWGAFGFKDYTNSYFYEGSDPQVKDGSYKGVSWWWRNIDIPTSFSGKTVKLNIRGARLRAEVYLNGQIVGYNIITETAFTADITKAMKSGQPNQLAIRITNPGGRFDWYDVNTMKWGNYEFHSSHGFGGIDRGLTLEAADKINISNFWVANMPDLTKVTAKATLQNALNTKATIDVTYSITDSTGKEIHQFIKNTTLEPNEIRTVETELQLTQAKPWSVETPVLYGLKITVQTKKAKIEEAFSCNRSCNFGFRWFDVDGIGTDASLQFNHQRIRVLSAISWGFWGINGLFPTPQLAEREVDMAKAIGLNCLQFHRNIGKTDVFTIQDKKGLLRYMEPGGGVTALGTKYYAGAFGEAYPVKLPINTTGIGGEALTFAEKYMEAKLMSMVLDHRNHPSLVMYVVQNEMAPDLANPRIYHILRAMHKLDPSRLIVLHSGVPITNQAWMRPYNDSIFTDNGNGFSGWADQHTVGGPGVWKDNMYTSPDSFTHKAMNKTEINMWGEMLGSAVPDNHALMVQQLKQQGGKSYDLKDHEEILSAYNSFLDKWGFRKAFPDNKAFFDQIGAKSYEFWGKVIETTKLSDENDYLVVSGWETTAIENHSGIVDNLRQPKGDINLMSRCFKPLHPVIRLSSNVIYSGSKATADLFFLNETNKPFIGNLKFQLIAPNGSVTEIANFEIPTLQPNKFVYLLQTKLELPPLTLAGEYKLKMVAASDTAVVATDRLLVLAPTPKIEVTQKIAITGGNDNLKEALKILYGINAEEYDSKKQYDLIVASHNFSTIATAKIADDIEGTDDDYLYQTENYGNNTNMEYKIAGLPNGKALVTFKFTEVYIKNKGMRLFDLAVNGKKVLTDFDILAQAGKMYKAVDTTVVGEVTNGMLHITIPFCKMNSAKICAFKVDIAGKTIAAINCGGEAYTDKKGLVWNRYVETNLFDESLLEKVKQGTSLLLIPQNEGASREYGNVLMRQGSIQCKGNVGAARQPWMGSWVFVRENPIFEGLPVNCVMTGEYQVGATDADGLIVDGNVNIYAGYSRDHDRNIGAVCFDAALGKGKVLYLGFNGIANINRLSEPGMHPLIAKKLLANTLLYLTK